MKGIGRYLVSLFSMAIIACSSKAPTASAPEEGASGPIDGGGLQVQLHANYAEFTVDGPLQQGIITTNAIDLGTLRQISLMEWASNMQEEMAIRFRVGSSAQETRRYFKTDGTEVTKEEYERLLSVFQGDVVPALLPDEEPPPGSRYFKKDGTEVSKDDYNSLLTLFRGAILGPDNQEWGWTPWQSVDSSFDVTGALPTHVRFIQVEFQARQRKPSATFDWFRIYFEAAE